MFDPLPSDIFHIGQILNNTYEIDGVLGRGGTGEAYLARNQVTGRMVAIKALNKQFSDNDAYRDLLKREVQMRDILDDAVVRYTECSRSDQGHVFLVMDYIDGPSIGELMLQRRLEPRELMIIGHRVAEGLMAAHAKGIVHRDLSPDNVILRGGNADRATIIDFGIAKDTAAGARTIVGNDFAGKYEYAASEQLEGRAEPRSDLYSLGAMLLAAYRGQVPFAGATPGEMVRRKQQPLDTTGVPEPLKGLIEWLTEPKLADRAPSAEAVVARLNVALRTQNQRGPKAAPNSNAKVVQKSRGGGLALWLVLPLVIVAGGAAAYFTGQFDRFFPQTLPVAAPYIFTAASPDHGAARFSGNAPDAAAAAVLSQAYEGLAKVAPPPAALMLAQGMPNANWPGSVADGLKAMAGLEDWSFEIADMTANVAGLAPDQAARQTAQTTLGNWANAGGFALTLSLQTGPKELSGGQVDDLLANVSDCGTLDRGDAPPSTYALGDTIRVFGSVADATRKPIIETALHDLSGDRAIELSLTPLNPAICKLRDLLPKAPANGVSILLSQGDTNQPNPSGVFHTGDNPVIQILVPATESGSSLTVFVVQDDGTILSLMPTVFHEDNTIDGLGTVQDSVRTITVAQSKHDPVLPGKPRKLEINKESYGKMEIVAILTRDDLFDLRRPGLETVEGLAEALAKIQDEMPGNVLAMATSLLESRP